MHHDDVSDDVLVVATTLDEFDRNEADLPLLLVCIDEDSGERTYAGPIQRRLDAERILRHERAAAGVGARVRFALVPLYPAYDPAEAEREGDVVAGPWSVADPTAV